MVDRTALEGLSDALVGIYRRSDIALYTVLIPKQDFSGGILRVRILEGYIDGVAIDGKLRHRRLIERYASKLTEQRPLKRSTLERYISLIRDISGTTTRVELLNGQSAQAVKLVLTPAEESLQVGLAANNRGTAYLGRTQFSADVYVNDVLRQGDQTRVTLAVPSNAHRFQYYAINQLEPISSSGDTLQLSAGYLRTQPTGTDLLGHATSVGIVASHPLIRSYSRDAYLTLGLDGLDANNALLGARLSDERTRVARIGTVFSQKAAHWQFAGSGALSFGLPAFGARPVDPGLSDVAFKKFNARAAFSARLPASFILRLNATAQWSGDRLPASEQFVLGGADFGRAYEAAVIAGDYGLAGSAEIAFKPSGLPDALNDAEAYTFADAGKLWFRGRLGSPTQEAYLSSAGVGVRVPIVSRWSVQLEAARTLPNALSYLDRNDWRAIFSVRFLR